VKLLLCTKCNTIFNLKHELKSCLCGEVKGRYINNVDAEVNGKGYSLAIGNGSLWNAISLAEEVEEDWRNSSGWQTWWEQRPSDTMFLAWARPHADKANLHTIINPEL
jgi:hypothetical protein